MRTLWSIWTWACVLLSAVVAVILMALLWPFGFLDPQRKRGRILRWAGIWIARLAPMWNFGVYGPIRHRPSKTVVVSNHCSHTDSFLISHLPWEMKWLGKAELFPVPPVGWAMFLAGDVPVVRGDKQSALEAMARCARYLESGMPVMIFPEGTRSKTGHMGPFKVGAFRLAIETGADVLPIAVAGTTRALTKHDWRFNRAKARVTVGEPISTRGMTLEDVEELSQQARAAIDALRTEMIPHTSDADLPPAPEADKPPGQ